MKGSVLCPHMPLELTCPVTFLVEVQNQWLVLIMAIRHSSCKKNKKNKTVQCLIGAV